MKLYQKVILPLGFLGMLVACSTSTQLRKSWSDPALSGTAVKPFKKVMVIVRFKNEVARKVAEDKIAEAVKNGVAVQSYTYLTPADTSQKLLVEKLKNDGYDGVITMRLKSVVKTHNSSPPGTPFVSFYTVSYGYGYGYNYSYTIANTGNNPQPPDVSKEKNFIVETNIYSLESTSLLWSGVTASLNPKKLDKGIDGIIKTVKQELEKKGLLK